MPLLNMEDHIKKLLYSSVLIKENTFPRLYSIIQQTFHQLAVTPDATSLFFVYASNDLQAFYHLSKGKTPVFVFSSALIERFNDKEIAFVIGHEYGHYFYGHGHSLPTNDHYSIMRENMLSRAAEISADRMGLIACQDINTATAVCTVQASGGESYDWKCLKGKHYG